MKKMKKVCQSVEDNIQYIAYDTSIQDVEERRRMALVFLSGRSMSRALGICQASIARFVSKEAISEQRRYHSERMSADFAIRVYKKAK